MYFIACDAVLSPLFWLHLPSSCHRWRPFSSLAALLLQHAVRQMQFSYICICRTIMLVDWIEYNFLHWWTRTWASRVVVGVKIIDGAPFFSKGFYDIIFIFIRLIRCTYAKKKEMWTTLSTLFTINILISMPARRAKKSAIYLYSGTCQIVKMIYRKSALTLQMLHFILSFFLLFECPLRMANALAR